MATIKMKKGEVFADIFDSPETILQARKEGYHIASEEELTGSAVCGDDDDTSKSGRKAGKRQ
jgi:hypothetical protein